MAGISLRERIGRDPLLLDGAMGTELMARGVKAGTCSAYLNVESPDIVLTVHQSYVQVGSDAILTNTFGANRYVLARHGHADKVAQINTAGAQIARQAAGEEKYVLGNIGPSGDFLEPLGTLKADQLKNAFAEQADALLAGGVDGFIVETMTALDELSIAVQAAKSVNGELPVFASMSFDRAGRDFRTMMGVDVEAAISKMVELGADAVGFNCGTLTLDQYVTLAEKYVPIAEALADKAVVLAEPNGGEPELIDGKTSYLVLPADFASAAERMWSAGVTIIGGCCGTSPAHIRAMAKKLKK
ncbi:MAG: homocysteine S-methyltransferase family protein [Phycisphaerales bacterium]|nr:MAG: homocysteine S-methyltransferase family protein [Phycisphaerales bacterium]